MKRRRLVLSPPLLPTITETLEDTSNQCSQPLEDYMTSIQALARPVEAPSHSITRFQRSPRTRHFAKGQVKLSASPRTLRTSRPKTKDYGLSGNITEELPLKTGRDCRDKDPLDWLFGQRTWTARLTYSEGFKQHIVGTSHKKNQKTYAVWKGHSSVWMWWLVRKVKIYLFSDFANSSLEIYMFNIFYKVFDIMRNVALWLFFVLWRVFFRDEDLNPLSHRTKMRGVLFNIFLHSHNKLT